MNHLMGAFLRSKQRKNRALRGFGPASARPGALRAPSNPLRGREFSLQKWTIQSLFACICVQSVQAVGFAAAVGLQNCGK
jgi:hypothetical protein